MKKIPSLFRRDFDNNPRLVLPIYNDGVEWVVSGEGVATRKWDGTACLIKDGVLYRRYDAKHGKPAPENGIPCQDPDPETGHWPHWVPADEGSKADRWIMEAFKQSLQSEDILQDGTYEAVGPKINGNKDGFQYHHLIRHDAHVWDNVPVTFNELGNYFAHNQIEGIVWHHPDGRMCKIKGSDFGLPW